MAYVLYGTKIRFLCNKKNKNRQYFLEIKEIVLPLHSQKEICGGIAQLVRASDS